MQQYHSTNPDPFGYSSRAGSVVFPDLTTHPHPQQPSLIPWNLPQVHHVDPFLFPSPSSSSSYSGLFTRRPSNNITNYNNSLTQFAYDGFLSDANPFGLQDEFNKLTAQEIMDAKALAASKSHSEAERRRRERINNHLAKLRSLLPSTTKTDKASLLAEVIQHVKELRRQTSIIAETSVVPTETDELTVDAASDGEDGRLIIKASLCCDDRNDLLPDLIKALKSLRLRTLKAEITTLGGRVKNVLYFTHDYSDDYDNGDNDDEDEDDEGRGSIGCIQEALREVMEKSKGGDECNTASGNAKRQRTTTTVNLS